MIKAAIETLKLLLVGERNWLFNVFIDESNTNIFQWNAKQSDDLGGKIPPAWFLMKICKFSQGVGLLEFESNETWPLGDKAQIQLGHRSIRVGLFVHSGNTLYFNF
jgi:hypothetical protein